MNELLARAVAVVNPIDRVFEEASSIFSRSVAVWAVNEFTCTVLPILGRIPVVVDAASRTTLLFVVETEKVPAACAEKTDH